MTGGRMRRLALVATVAVALLGLIAFIGGITVEFFSQRQVSLIDTISPALVTALVGLCLAAAMALVWFVIVGLALARQTRVLGSGYGDAYRLIESFRFREAIPLLERSIREGKETPDVLMLLTSAYAYAGQFARAQATADRAVQLFPQDPDAYITLANGYRLQASYEEAAKALHQAAVLSPEQPIIWAELGFMQRYSGDENAALASFEQAATHAMPATYGVRVYYHLAQAYQKRGETQKAVRSASKMMSARNGLAAWRSGLRALEGAAYGQALRYEIQAIEQAIDDADAGNLG